MMTIVPSVSRNSQSMAEAQQLYTERTKTRIKIITIVPRTNGVQVDAWVKNTGMTSINAVGRSDVFLIRIDGTWAEAMTHDNNGGSKTWSGGLAEWDQGDTLRITIDLSDDALTEGIYLLRVATPNGTISERIFEVTPTTGAIPTPTPTPTPTPIPTPTPPSLSGRILYRSASQIWIMNADGTGQTQLTTAGGLSPHGSADGSKITYIAKGEEPPSAPNYPFNSVYTMSVDGSNKRQVTRPYYNNPPWPSDNYPHWCNRPDGEWIIFESVKRGSPLARIYAVAGGGLESHPPQIRNSAEYVSWGYPRCSPDGSKILFASGRGGGGLFTMDSVTGANIQQLASGSYLHPEWSPDGSKIAFTRGSEFYVMDADGSNQVALVSNAYYPQWSPDGNWIAFTSSPSDAIEVVRPDGSGRMTAGTGFVADWMP